MIDHPAGREVLLEETLELGAVELGRPRSFIEDDQRLTGIGFSTKSPHDVRRLVEQDPSVKVGLESVKTVTYTFPKGVLAFPRAQRPQA